QRGQRDRGTGGGEVERLAAAHAGRAAGGGQLGQHRHPRGVGGRGRGEGGERQRLQRVAGQDRGRFAVGHVHGRLAAAQGVVVHRRQVVVHQRIGMHQLDRGGGRVQRVL